MDERLFSIKYQLKDEQDTIRMRLKKITNLARRLTNRGLPVRIGLWGGQGDCIVVIVESERFVDQMIQVFRKFNTQETRSLEIDGNLQPFNRHRLGRKLHVSI